MTKSLRFVGQLWVNAVTRLHDQQGHFDRTYLYPGKVMSWEEFLSAYSSGQLWTDNKVELEGSEFSVLGDAKVWISHPHGALVRPARGNNHEQPVTSAQAYIMGAGLWCVIESEDPNYLAWAYLPGSGGRKPFSRDEFESVVEELESCPAPVAALPSL